MRCFFNFIFYNIVFVVSVVWLFGARHRNYEALSLIEMKLETRLFALHASVSFLTCFSIVHILLFTYVFAQVVLYILGSKYDEWPVKKH